MTSRFHNFHPSEGQRWFRLLPTIVLVVLSIAIPTVLFEHQRVVSTQAAPSQPAALPSIEAPPATYDSPLGLRVESKPQQLEVYWDRDRQSIRDAKSAVMRITDGGVSEVIPFDTQQLKDGYLAYKPVTNDVNIRFEADQGNGQTVAESVRVIATP